MRLAAVFLLLTCAAHAQTPDWQRLPRALAQAEQNGQPALVYVEAPWCGPCRQLERDTFSDARVEARLGDFALARLVIDDRDRTHRVGPYRLSEAAWAQRLGATVTPTLVLLAPDGSVLARQEGLVAPTFLLSILDAALAASAR